MGVVARVGQCNRGIAVLQVQRGAQVREHSDRSIAQKACTREFGSTSRDDKAGVSSSRPALFVEGYRATSQVASGETGAPRQDAFHAHDMCDAAGCGCSRISNLLGHMIFTLVPRLRSLLTIIN